jgi:hypothetical protein
MSRAAAPQALLAALGDAQAALERLGAAARRLGDRHPSDHEMAYAGRVLGLELDAASARLAGQAERLGRAPGGPAPDGDGRGPSSDGSPGARRLADLRGFLGTAAEASIACVILRQGAMAAREAEVLEGASSAQGTVQRAHRWALTQLKATAAQVLARRDADGART